jgi:phage gp36-like protein
MYLTAQEFTERLTALTAITGGEHKRTLVARALEQAHAALDAELSKRYTLPIDPNTVPQHTRDLLKRWAFYFAVRELLGLQGVSVSREEQPVLSEIFEMVDAHVQEYCTGGALLDGVPSRSRVRVGYGELSE